MCRWSTSRTSGCARRTAASRSARAASSTHCTRRSTGQARLGRWARNLLYTRLASRSALLSPVPVSLSLSLSPSLPPSLQCLTKPTPTLCRAGLALPTTSALGDETVGGVVSTATHNTGRSQQLLAAYVRALTLVTADGVARRLVQGADEMFPYALCSCGTMGVITSVEFEARADPVSRTLC